MANLQVAINELANLEDQITRMRFSLQRQSGSTRTSGHTKGGGSTQYSSEQSRGSGGGRRGRKQWSQETGGGRGRGQGSTADAGNIDQQIRGLRSRFDKVMNRLTTDDE